jgi:hypothetical protein
VFLGCYTDVDEIVWVYVGCDATITAVDVIPVRPTTSVLPTIDNSARNDRGCESPAEQAPRCTFYQLGSRFVAGFNTTG